MLMPEILELILLQLPLQDLLVTAQRVCCAWKAVIDSSSPIQQALFFRPLHPASVAAAAPHAQRPLNPLLQAAFPPWFRSTHQPACPGPKVVESMPWARGDPAHRAAFMRDDASWRRMLPCQPAKRVLEVAGKESSARGIFETNGTVGPFEDGIRMGTLYDLGIEVVRRHVSTFWILWDGVEDGAGGERANRLTMFTQYSWFKFTPRPDTPPDVGDEFRSEAHQNLTISNLREEKRSRQWHAGFGNLPLGGWMLRQP